MRSDHHLLLLDAVALGKNGVEQLMAELHKAYDVGEFFDDVEYESRLAELHDLIDAYDALPNLRMALAESMSDDQADMTVAVQLVQNGLRLRQLYRGFHDALALPTVPA